MKAVLTFHAVDHVRSPLSYPPEAFRALVETLIETGTPILTLDDLLDPATPHGVALTFDDGLASVHDAALPILKAFDAPAHMFLPTAYVGQDNAWPGQPESAPRYATMTWDQIEALHNGGVRIESHTHRHPDLRPLPTSRIAEEMEMADQIITTRLGRRPRYFAYPYGFHDAAVREEAGRRYRASFTTQLAYLGDGDDPTQLPRLDSHYLRQPWLLRRLSQKPVREYIGLRHLIRQVRNRS
ncbi:MAG: polysaccharide deacetylase family protein [Brevundimonas sp.]